MNKSIRLIGLGLIASMLFGACIKHWNEQIGLTQATSTIRTMAAK